MDAHFQLLGLKRGCDEEAVRKAYRQRALEYHPDRNPNGAETFKRIQVSYEAITQHLKAHGGRDVYFPSGRNSSSGSAYSYARRQQQQQQQQHPHSGGSGGGSGASAYSPPLFTDEELFGDGNHVPGGFASEARRAEHNAGGGTSNSSSTRNPPGGRRTSASSYARTDAHAKADAHWHQAHGTRVPVSGYDGGRGGGGRQAPPPRPPASPSSPLFTARGVEDDEASFKELYKAYLAKGYGTAGGKPTVHAYVPDNDEDDAAQEKIRAMWRDLDHMQSTEEKQAALKASWATLQREIGRKMKQQQQDQQQQQREHAKRPPSEDTKSATDASASYAAVEREMAAQAEAARREWQARRDNFLRQEEAAREDARKRAAEDILRRHEAEQRRQAALEAVAQAERMAASEKHMDEISGERRLLTRQLFAHKYTPDPAEVGDMTDTQVYILGDLLRQAQQRVEKVLQARLARGVCSRCQAAPKAVHVHVFVCAHGCVCEDCAAATRRCPLCGADRVTPLPTSPRQPRADQPDADQAPEPTSPPTDPVVEVNTTRAPTAAET